jgi:hypothetical protein
LRTTIHKSRCEPSFTLAHIAKNGCATTRIFAGIIMPRYPREKVCLFWGFYEAFSKGMSDIRHR